MIKRDVAHYDSQNWQMGMGKAAKQALLGRESMPETVIIAAAMLLILIMALVLAVTGCDPLATLA